MDFYQKLEGPGWRKVLALQSRRPAPVLYSLILMFANLALTELFVAGEWQPLLRFIGGLVTVAGIFWYYAPRLRYDKWEWKWGLLCGVLAPQVPAMFAIGSLAIQSNQNSTIIGAGLLLSSFLALALLGVYSSSETNREYIVKFAVRAKIMEEQGDALTEEEMEQALRLRQSIYKTIV